MYCRIRTNAVVNREARASRHAQNNIDVGGTEGIPAVDDQRSWEPRRLGDELSDRWDEHRLGSGQTAACQIYYDPFMFEQLNYQTGGVSAETSRGGIRLQHGYTDGNEHAARARSCSTGRTTSCSSTTSRPSCARSCYIGVPPLALEANPDLEPGSKVISDVRHWVLRSPDRS